MKHVSNSAPRLKTALRNAVVTAGKTAAGIAAGLALYGVVDTAPAFAQAAVAAPTTAPAPQAGPGPALWVVRDADSTIYLFGTVHLMRPEVQWRTPAFEAALAASDAVYFEIKEVDPESAANMQPLLMKYGLAPAGEGLSTVMNEADMARIDAVAASLGAPQGAFEPMRPWLAAMQVTVAGIMKAGYSPTSGVDPLIKAQAVAAGKPIHALETVEQQLGFFADLPMDVQADFLRQSLADFDVGAAKLDSIVEAWATGDAARLETEIVDEFKKWPAVYDAILVRRNADWARQIKTMLDGSGTVFIAVGGGHLVGEDSVQAALAREGVTAERL